MKINGSNYAQFIHQVYKRNSENQWEKREKNELSKDRIELSKSSRDVQKYIKRLKEMGTGNQEKIQRIKDSLEKGSYKVSSRELAEIIVDRMNQQKGIGEE